MRDKRKKVYLYGIVRHNCYEGGFIRDKRKKVYLYGIVRHNCYAGFVPVYTAKNKRGAVIGFHYEKEAKRLPIECMFLCETETTQSALTLRNRRFFKHEMRKV